MKQVRFSQETEIVPINASLKANVENYISDVKGWGMVDLVLGTRDTLGLLLSNQVGKPVQAGKFTSKAHRSSICGKEPLTSGLRDQRTQRKSSAGCVGVWGVKVEETQTGVLLPRWGFLARVKKFHNGDWCPKKRRARTQTPFSSS